MHTNASVELKNILLYGSEYIYVFLNYRLDSTLIKNENLLENNNYEV